MARVLLLCLCGLFISEVIMTNDDGMPDEIKYINVQINLTIQGRGRRSIGDG